MGCNNGKMVKVEPQPMNKKQHQTDADINNNREQDKNVISSDKRTSSAVSKTSKHSNDSAFIDGESDSIRSLSAARRKNSGLKRTLQNLSAKSQRSVAPREEENDVLQKLRSEGFLTTDTHKAKSGVAFELIAENSQHRKLPPARLAKLEKQQKRRKLLTQKDIETKLQNAERRRKEAESERLDKIQSVTIKSDIHNALDNFVEHQKQVKEHVQEKVDSATENRAKKLRELREKLRAKEEHAALVRQRKKTLEPTKISENGEAQTAPCPEP